MPAPLVDDQQFLEMFTALGAHETARRIKCSVRAVYDRRKRMEYRMGMQITGPMKHNTTRQGVAHPQRTSIEIDNGVVIIGSDAHYWPGEPSTAHRAFVKFCKELRPVAVIKNGDALDGSAVSRHSPIGWEDRPKLIDELKACTERLAEIRKAAPKARFVWPLGNHDGRFETRLATVAPEFARIHGVHLKDHFPDWEPCWSVWLNDDVVVKHRFKGGIHATHNNTLWAGKTVITGHLHSLKVTPFTDYNGTRFGVDCGTMADPDGPQFRDYTEENPKNWRSGFVVLTFRKGRLLWPEVCHVIGEGEVEFRGKVLKV